MTRDELESLNDLLERLYNHALRARRILLKLNELGISTDSEDLLHLSENTRMITYIRELHKRRAQLEEELEDVNV